MTWIWRHLGTKLKFAQKNKNSSRCLDVNMSSGVFFFLFFFKRLPLKPMTSIQGKRDDYLYLGLPRAQASVLSLKIGLQSPH